MTDLAWAVDGADGVIMGSHELSLWPVIADLLPEGGVFLDVGAHMGLWTVRLGGKASRIYAIEPNPETAKILRENIALNGLDGKVLVEEVAAWDSDGIAHLVAPEWHDHDPRTGWMMTRDGEGDDADSDVPARRLDGVIFPDRLDLVKIDTEGADIRVLHGMIRLLADHRPVLFIEGHHILPDAYTAAELTGAVEELGYGWEWGPEFNTVPYLICRPL